MAGSEHESNDLPLLALVCRSRSIGVFALATAAKGTCRLAFLVDGDPSLKRLLGRLGPVVDITGLDAEQTLERARSLAPDGITTFADRDLLRTACLAEGLGLPFHSTDTAASLIHKHKQREALRRAGLPGPDFSLVSKGRDRDTKLHELQYPVVVKPDTGTASRETTLACDVQEVLHALERASRLGIEDVLVEELLPDAPELMAPNFASFVSVESIVSREGLRHLAVTGKFPLAHPFRETGHFIPSHLPDAVITDVLGAATMAIEAVGITLGAVHTEVKLTPSGPRIIEVNGRIGGAVPEVLSQVNGYDLLESAMKVALGQGLPLGGLLPCGRIGYRVNVQPPTWARRVRSIEGFDTLKAFPGVDSVGVLRTNGDAVDWRLGTEEFVLVVQGSVGSLDELQAVRTEIDKKVTINYE